MTAPKANPKRAGRKPGPRIPCGGCFQELTAREWKGHFAGCAGKGAAKLDKLLSGEWDVTENWDGKFAVWRGQSTWSDRVPLPTKRIGPWRVTPIEAVRDCPLPKGKA